MEPVVLTTVLRHHNVLHIRLLEILLPIPMVWLTRDHDEDARKLPHSDVAVPTATAMSSSLARARARASAFHAGQAPIPQAQSWPRRAAQKPMCSGVPELCLSSAEDHARLHQIDFEVNSIYSILWSHRTQHIHPSPSRLPLSSLSTTASLLPAHHQLSLSGLYLPPPPNGRHPSPCRSPATAHLSCDSAVGILLA
uniref:Uncharacterized protein n=1 Tax=Oryza punctata TaxID=4537 RepID=A0A0E0M4Y3_ORYPU